MMEIFQTFVSMLDLSWNMELLLISFSWALLIYVNERPLRLILHVAELFCCMFAAKMLTFIIIQFSGEMKLFTSSWSVVHGIVSFLFLYLHSQMQKRSALLQWLTLYNCVVSLAALTGQASYLFGLLVESGFMHDNIRLFLYMIMPLMALLVRKCSFDEFTKIPNSAFLLAAFICVSILVCSFVEGFVYSAGETVIELLLMFYACMLITSVAAMQALYTLCKEQAELSELKAERQRDHAEHEMTRMAETTLEDLRCIRHDLKNQYAFMQILLEEERYPELKEYFADMQVHLPAPLSLIDSGNRTVDTVLNMEFSKLRARNLPFEHQLVVPPVLPFRDQHICSILTNLLDNAAEECSRLQKKGENDLKIRLEIYPYQSYLYIRCLNSTDSSSLEHNGVGLRTTKKDRTVHGYGTKIIARLAERYNGCVDYHLDGGMFVAQVMLDMTETEGKHEN